MKQLFASALLLLAPAWVMAQGSGAATPAKPASAKQATAAKGQTRQHHQIFYRCGRQWQDCSG